MKLICNFYLLLLVLGCCSGLYYLKKVRLTVSKNFALAANDGCRHATSFLSPKNWKGVLSIGNKRLFCKNEIIDCCVILKFMMICLTSLGDCVRRS